MAFNILNKEIVKWLESKGYVEESLVQRLTIPEIVSGENVLVMAPTGHGKTLAAILPIFNKLLEEKGKEGVKLLYITPLKSLNRNLEERIMNLADKIGLSVDLRHGDTPQNIRKQQVDDPADMLIITPETLQSLLIGKKSRNVLRNVKYVVIDEIHELSENKRGSQLMVALERLKRLCGDFKRIGLSATIGNPETVSMFLTGGKKCKVIYAQSEKKYDIKIEYPKPEKVDISLAKQLRITPNGAFCMRRIKELIELNASTIIFVNTRETAESLGARFKIWEPNLKIAVHHSSLSKEERINVENQFKEGKIKAIISTSSLELGIDIGSIDFVIQYGSPRQATKLVQRIGRSGHGIGKISRGIILCNSVEDYLEAKAIVKKVDENWLEEPNIIMKPLDILAHQIVGLCIDFSLDGKNPTKDELYNIIKGSYPFQNLTENELEDVIQVLRDIYILGEENGKYFRTRKGLLYYFENLSTIPNEKNYEVINLELNRRIGILHQGFVAQYIKQGVEFIMKGEPWKVVECTDNKITVISGKNTESAVPSWEGELIPVPKEIAELAGEYRKSEEFEELEIQKRDFVVPTIRNIYIENCDDYLIIHSCFGSKINETLSKVIGALISARTGIVVGTRNDAYRIMLKMQEFGKEQITQVFDEIEPEYVETILKKNLKNSSIFEFKFFQIAKRFGVIGKDAEYSLNTIQKLIDIYADTAVFKETINELLSTKLDILGSVKVIEDIRSGQIKITTSWEYETSPLGKEGLNYSSISLIKPKENMKEIYDLIKNRLLEKKFWFICMRCKEPHGVFAVKNIPENLKCKNCGAKTIGFIPSKNKDSAKKIISKKDELCLEEKLLLKNLNESAELFLNYGKEAVFVLAGYGVGLKTAKRILKRYNKNENELIRDIVEAERTFISNKQFWK